MPTFNIIILYRGKRKSMSGPKYECPVYLVHDYNIESTLYIVIQDRRVASSLLYRHLYEENTIL